MKFDLLKQRTCTKYNLQTVDDNGLVDFLYLDSMISKNRTLLNYVERLVFIDTEDINGQRLKRVTRKKQLQYQDVEMLNVLSYTSISLYFL